MMKGETTTSSKKKNASVAALNDKTHSFEPLQSGDVQEGDSSKVQDQAVEVQSGDNNVSRKLGVPVDPGRKVLEVSRQVQLLHVALIL